MAKINVSDFPTWWQVWFWETKFRWDLDTGCLEWIKKPDVGGYGKIAYKGRYLSAHRVAYALYYGEVPDELLVRHLCHNRLCSNPRHLTLGTHQDNSNDMVQAGRSQVGDRHWMKRQPERFKEWRKVQKGRFNLPKPDEHPSTKLTEEKVREIKMRAANGEGNKELAEAFGVTHSNISAIVLGKSWAHVDVPTRVKDERFAPKI